MPPCSCAESGQEVCYDDCEKRVIQEPLEVTQELRYMEYKAKTKPVRQMHPLLVCRVLQREGQAAARGPWPAAACS